MAYAYKKKSTWYAGYTNDAGRPTQKATKARTKTEATRIAEELERTAERVRLGLETRSADLTVGGLFEVWSEAKASLTTAGNDKLRWRLHLKDDLENVPLRQLTPVMLEKLLLSKLRAGGSREKGKLSPQSVHHNRRVIGRMFRWAIKKGIWHGSDPASKVELPQVAQNAPKTADPATIPLMLAAAHEPYRTAFAIGIYAGLRSAEILGLEVERVNLTAGVIMVERTVTSETTKGKRWRAIPIVTELRPYLAEHLKSCTTGRIFHMPSKDPRGHLLGELRRTLARAGLDQALTVHALRHTFISQLIMSGVDPRAAQALAGHSDFSTTQRYISLRDSYLVTQINKLDYAPVKPEERN